MAENSLIAWTHHTFNPWIGCVKVSDGCKHCYAETLVKNRMGRPHLWGPAKTHHRERTTPAYWQRARVWNRKAQKEGIAMRVFAASLADVFEEHPDVEQWRAELFALIRETPFLWWLLLTKRPENLERMLPTDWGRGYPNVWLGTSIENMEVAWRARMLEATPAVVRFISYEPALGSLSELDLTGTSWVIYGGESGSGFRQHDVEWARQMRRKCEAQGAAFFYKQSSAARTEQGIFLDGKIVRAYPVPRLRDRHDELAPGAHGAYAARIASDHAEALNPPTVDPKFFDRRNPLPILEG